MIEDRSANKFQKIFIVLLVSVLSILFLYMIRNFITSILLAAIFTGMFFPFYKRILSVLRGRKYIAAGVAVVLSFLLVFLPLMGLFNVVIKEARSISERLSPEIQAHLESGADTTAPLPEWIPFGDFLEPFKEQIFSNLDATTSRVISFLVNNMSTFGQGTIVLIMNVFVLLYAMYFFFIQGERILEVIKEYVPLTAEEFQTLVTQGMVVTLATLKGAVFIGILQGSLVGLAFWVLGIQGAFFWGTIAAVVSVVPTFGSGIVWIPTVVYLLLTGEVFSALALLAWGAGVVGVVDNLLRPHLVGKEAHMPDLLILVSTLGGLGLFGATGFIIGPVLAAFLITVWGIFKHTFETELN